MSGATIDQRFERVGLLRACVTRFCGYCYLLRWEASRLDQHDERVSSRLPSAAVRGLDLDLDLDLELRCGLLCRRTIADGRWLAVTVCGNSPEEDVPPPSARRGQLGRRVGDHPRYHISTTWARSLEVSTEQQQHASAFGRLKPTCLCNICGKLFW